MDRRRPAGSVGRAIRGSSGWKSFPSTPSSQKGAEQQMLVRAHFSDGHSEDVTTWAKFTSTNQTVCQVDDVGKVKITGNGEGSIVAWYLSKNVVASVTSPFENRLPADTFAKADRRNFIDDHILEKLRHLNVPPSPVCSDGEFLRRASLDTIGLLPTADEARAFLADRAARQARPADRAAAQPAGVRRLLVVQVVRPAAGLQCAAAAQGGRIVLEVDPQTRRGQ